MKSEFKKKEFNKSDWDDYDFEGNPKPPLPPADRIERHNGLDAIIYLLILICVGIIIAIELSN